MHRLLSCEPPSGAARYRAISRLTEASEGSGPYSRGSSTLSLSSGARRSRSSLLTETLSEPWSPRERSSSLSASEARRSGVGRSGVAHAAFNVMAEVMGAGMLSLPHAIATLGWVVGLSSVGLFGALSA